MEQFLNEFHTDCEICHFLMAKNLIKDAMQCSHCHVNKHEKPSGCRKSKMRIGV